MVVNSTVSGKTIKCTVVVFSNGQMVALTKVNTTMIRKRVMVFFFGLITESMMVIGRKGSKKASVFTTMQRER